MRQLAKAVLTRAASYLSKDQGAGRAVVLCYHSVHPSASCTPVTPEAFALHLDWLQEHCQVVPLATIARGSLTPSPSRPTVAITFDDGYADNYDFACPLLEQHGFTATFFLTVGFLEKDPAVETRMRRLLASQCRDARPLDWTEVRRMHAAGMEIGAHTYSHPNLARLDRSAARAELQRSKNVIEQHLGTAVRSVAYPFGIPRRHFTAETVALVEELGYDYACAVLYRAARQPIARFAIPRFSVRSAAIDELRAMIVGAWDPISLWQANAPVWLARRLSTWDSIT